MERVSIMKKLFPCMMLLALLLSVFSPIGAANASTKEYNDGEYTSEKTVQLVTTEGSLDTLIDEVDDSGEITTQSIKDGEEAYELGFLISHGLLFEDTYAWHESKYLFPAENLVVHFIKHGKEVGAADAKSYLNKSIEFKRTAKKGVQGKPVSGYVDGVKRYTKNGRYIDLAPNGKIISFGSSK